MWVRRLVAIAFVATSIASSLAAQNGSKLIDVLKRGDVAFGNFAREKTEEAARTLGSDTRLDFVFYDMERGDFDVPTLRSFLAALRSNAHPPTVIVRIPPIHPDPAAAKERTEHLIEAGADGVAFPHIMSSEEARLAVSWIAAKTERMWPDNPGGDFVSFVMIEDPDVVPQASDITRTPGVSIFSPGPGSLRGAYEGDMDKVTQAVNAVLEACHTAKVPCANTASEADVEAKVEAGFRVLIALGEETLTLGRAAAGRE